MAFGRGKASNWRWCFCWALSEHVRTSLYLSGSGFCGSHWKWSDYSLGLTRDLLWRHTEKKVSLLVALIVSITFHYTRSCEAISIAWANMSDDVRCYISEELLVTFDAFRMKRSGGHCATDQSQTWQLPWVDVATTSWNRGPVAVQKCKKESNSKTCCKMLQIYVYTVDNYAKHLWLFWIWHLVIHSKWRGYIERWLHVIFGFVMWLHGLSNDKPFSNTFKWNPEAFPSHVVGSVEQHDVRNPSSLL